MEIRMEYGELRDLVDGYINKCEESKRDLLEKNKTAVLAAITVMKNDGYGVEGEKEKKSLELWNNQFAQQSSELVVLKRYFSINDLMLVLTEAGIKSGVFEDIIKECSGTDVSGCEAAGDLLKLANELIRYYKKTAKLEKDELAFYKLVSERRAGGKETRKFTFDEFVSWNCPYTERISSENQGHECGGPEKNVREPRAIIESLEAKDVLHKEDRDGEIYYWFRF